ncbi:cytochrome c-type biogenesis protein CcmH [Octadecabacter sp. SW4]|uniref:cytochrome c-type biogenesis protein n=1 Tax=Octadecabacter sp. SW4 TaxID=2602067 RepID=UPI0011C1E80D|nr:cytochrome c-type biogenesis protein [Octadecabacter sp. SW4]QEE35741.1 cytochrome c-type biogenesis protein CcmH [Octadecabacter sp. SW4]|tara:strand:+ start:1697 stop:2143 length:447 start_codon:yes stop_codon:yes gene_type:complete
MKRLVLIFLLLAAPLYAVQPDEILDDPVLEERARELSQGLRCPVCRNESIDESNSDVSRDLRILLRQRLVAGDSDAEAVQYIVDRYGEFVLLRPVYTGANRLLWAAGPVMFILALLIGYRVVRARANATPDKDLDSDEQKRLDEILRS